ncbi:MAG: acetolactate synthase [Angelakisella sp.]|nr:acetolactate synthase [Angelakisella sp.]
MTIKQLSVFVENKQGRLSEITGILQGAGVDIRALSLADTTDFGILRLIVDKEDVAEAALRGAGLTVSLTPVIAAGIADRPGGLAEAMALLRDGGISVEYMYAFISRRKEMAYVILRVDDNGKAAELLQKAAFPLLTEEEIAE